MVYTSLGYFGKHYTWKENIVSIGLALLAIGKVWDLECESLGYSSSLLLESTPNRGLWWHSLKYCSNFSFPLSDTTKHMSFSTVGVDEEIFVLFIGKFSVGGLHVP